MVSLSPEQKRQVTNALDALLLDRVDGVQALVDALSPLLVTTVAIPPAPPPGAAPSPYDSFGVKYDSPDPQMMPAWGLVQLSFNTCYLGSGPTTTFGENEFVLVTGSGVTPKRPGVWKVHAHLGLTIEAQGGSGPSYGWVWNNAGMEFQAPLIQYGVNVDAVTYITDTNTEVEFGLNLPADTQLAGLGVTEAELFLTPVLIN